MSNRFRAAHCVLALTAVFVSVLAPAWSQALSIHGYYADLSTTIVAKTPFRAGRPVDFEVRVRNHGPDAVGQSRLVVRGDDGFGAASIEPCVSYFPSCAIGALLDGQTAILNVRSYVAPSARGAVAFGAFAYSEADDTLPHNDLAVIGGTIELEADLAVALATDRRWPWRHANGALEWWVDVRNFGPSDARAPSVSIVSLEGRAEIAFCSAAGDAACPPSGGAYIAPPGYWRLVVIGFPDHAEAPLSWRLVVAGSEGAVDAPRPNTLEVHSNPPLMADGFE